MDPKTKMKYHIGLLAVFIWIVAIVAKHFWADIEVNGLITMAVGTLTGLGVLHLNAPSNSDTSKPEQVSLNRPPTETKE